jgi:hypothetical protein
MCQGSMSRNSRPIPTRGFTTRTTASTFTFWPLRMSVPRTRAPTSKVRGTQTKHPPRERSEVTPLTRVPDCNCIISASAAKGLADRIPTVTHSRFLGAVAAVRFHVGIASYWELGLASRNNLPHSISLSVLSSLMGFALEEKSLLRAKYARSGFGNCV